MGLSEFQDLDGNFNRSLEASVGVFIDPNNTTSYTRSIEIKDWYSLHYLHTCEGYWKLTPDGSNYTATKANSTCRKQKGGYQFCLDGLVSPELNPSVQGIAPVGGCSSFSQDTLKWFVLWVIGVALSGLVCVLQPFMLGRRLH